MTYSNHITRLRPTAFVVLIDRSGSMAEKIVFAGTEMAKSRALAFVANAFIDELLYRARREGGTRDYYDIAVLGYSGCEVSSLVSPAGEFTSPSRLAHTRVRREKFFRERILPSGRSVVAVTEHNSWIDQRANGATPMCGALGEALTLVERWCRRGRNAASYPPTVINITDGETSDGSQDDVRSLAARLRETGTTDGATLLINVHLARGWRDGEAASWGKGTSADESPPGWDDAQVLFPSSPDELPDHRYARLLYDISSDRIRHLPNTMICDGIMIDSQFVEWVTEHIARCKRRHYPLQRANGSTQNPVSVGYMPEMTRICILSKCLIQSSEMPENYNDAIRSMRPGSAAPFRGMAFNSHIGQLPAMINIGSVNSIML